jgi:hypothetical protein
MKKLLLTITLVISIIQVNKAQQVQTYFDFDGTKNAYFGFSSGIIDSMASNPGMNPVDSSWYCARYIRDTTFYDNFQIHPNSKLRDISNFESASMSAPKIMMKIYSTAPVGSQITLQLGSTSIDAYPAGVRSEYIAYTSVKNAWQDLQFSFYQVTPGGTVTPTNIDKLVFLFRPETYSSDTLYFDNLKGPTLSPVGVPTIESMPGFKLYQNSPNPVKDNTHINFIINSPGEVSLKLYDMLGNPVSSLLEENLKAGSYSIPVVTDNIPNGIYFYVLKKEGSSKSMKMIISK